MRTVVLLSRPGGNVQEGGERRVHAVEDDAMSVVREILEDGIVDVNATEPNERRGNLGHEKRFDGARRPRARVPRCRQSNALRANVAARLDRADGGREAGDLVAGGVGLDRREDDARRDARGYLVDDGHVALEQRA
jgi:uncharacterized protein YfaP (DUF2135 family)